MAACRPASTRAFTWALALAALAVAVRERGEGEGASPWGPLVPTRTLAAGLVSPRKRAAHPRTRLPSRSLL